MSFDKIDLKKEAVFITVALLNLSPKTIACKAPPMWLIMFALLNISIAQQCCGAALD